jgi:hypothetical protein
VDEGAEDPESSKDIGHPARMSLWLQIVEERTYRGEHVPSFHRSLERMNGKAPRRHPGAVSPPTPRG